MIDDDLEERVEVGHRDLFNQLMTSRLCHKIGSIAFRVSVLAYFVAAVYGIIYPDPEYNDKISALSITISALCMADLATRNNCACHNNGYKSDESGVMGDN